MFLIFASDCAYSCVALYKRINGLIFYFLTCEFHNFFYLRMHQRQHRRRRILQEAMKKTKLGQDAHVVVKKDADDGFEDVSSSNDSAKPDFEDEFDDEYEREQGEIDLDSEEEEILQQELQVESQEIEPSSKNSTLKRKKPQMEAEKNDKRVWFYDDVENLDFDNRAYNMLHRVTTEWPCLSCDYVLPDEELALYRQKSYAKMDKYPYTVYLAAGTQAGQPSKNQIYLLKMSQLHKTKYDDDDVSQEEDSEDECLSKDEEGHVELVSVTGLKYSVNRIKAMDHQPIVAYWSESTDLQIVDLNPLYKALNTQNNQKRQFNLNQLHHKSFKNKQEGFALDWSKLKTGDLISGSLDARINLYRLQESDWIRQAQPYEYHKASVEDVQFSPVESFAFASCSVDGTVGVVDTRVGKYNAAQIQIKAHNCDVNVLSWNQVSANLLATGADDGCFKVWDLRYPKNDAISEISFHTKAITSIQFQPSSDSTLAVSSEDHKLTIWDFSVENDDKELAEIPDQLLFIHQGQRDLKELKYHPVYFEMLTSTSASGFNVFKPTLDEESSKSSSSEGEIPVIKESDLDEYFGKMSLK